MGIACAILIILFVRDEWTFDQFHTKADRIYRLYVESERQNGELNISPYTPHSMALMMQESYEEVEGYSVFNSFNDQVTRGDQSFSEVITLASADFFKILDFELKEGSLSSVLDDQNHVVVTETMATKYFGSETAIGQLMQVQIGEELRELEVKAVLKDLPSNSSFQFEILISDINAKYVFPEQMITSWNMISGVNYVLLNEGVDPAVLETKLDPMVRKALGERGEGRIYNIKFQAIKDIHLNTDMPQAFATVSDPKYTLILGGIALLILALACINFMILSIGRSMSRAKEIGVRKVIGANKSQLVYQFLSEAVLMAIFSLALGVVIALFVLPIFNELSGKRLVLNFDYMNVPIFVSLGILVGLIAGIYPAFVVSRFIPAKILKGGNSAGGKKEWFKMTLVGIQFVLSIFLVSSTLLMRQQMNHLQTMNLGFDKDQVLVVPINVYDARGIRNSITNGMEKSKIFKSRLEQSSSVASVSASSQDFGTGNWMILGYNDDLDESHDFHMNVVDADYVKTMGMEILSGRDFSKDIESDQRRSIIVNEAFVKAFDLEHPVGAKIPHSEFIDHEIIGVVKDFNFASLHAPIEPAILVMNGEIGFSGVTNLNIDTSPTPKMMIRLKQNSIQDGLAEVSSIWEDVYAGEPYSYDFVDEVLRAQYEEEQNLGTIVSIATGLAIVIACLGLFGLASLNMNSRKKEVSVRKVLGASIGNIMLILSKSYIVLIGIALMLSVPFSYYFISDWMNRFEYRITIGFGPYVLAGLITVIVALGTISYQCIKVAITNPARSLANE